MKNHFTTIAKTALVLVYLVIIAGALVRMTGSGMGCPDWPKCFGYYIPPTDIQELTWEENRTFKKGQVIIKDEALWVAKSNFTTNTEFNQNNWEKYTRHDYAVFNPSHTWTEYINRLVGALAGLGCLIMAITSQRFWKTNKKITILSWLVVAMMVFQAWLGATVVYSVLNPIKITIHMVMALVIVAVILHIIKMAKTDENQFVFDKNFKNLLWISLIFTLIQVVLGTQVRQFVDEQVKLGIENKSLWLSNANLDFYIHRTFSFLVVFVNLYLLIRNKKLNLGINKINWVFGILIIEILSGIAMYYFHFPFGTQSVHLVLASILFGIQYYMLLEMSSTKKAVN